jgi:uncharacterized repeat protein (TIGR03803 family)
MIKRGTAGLAIVIGAVLMSSSGTVQTQGTGSAHRSWSCLSASSSAATPFRNNSTSAACGTATIPAPWPFASRNADAIAPPGAPSGLAASISGSTVVLTWNAPASGGAPSTYVVVAGSSPGLANLVNTNLGSTATSVTAAGVPPGVYYVRIFAQNASGGSPASNEIAVTVGGAAPGCNIVPAVPTGLTTSSNGSTVTITWQRPLVGCPPTYYVIQAGSAPGLSNLANFSTGNDSTSFSASGVGNGVYYIRILAGNAAGTGGASPDVPLVVGGGGCSGPPGAPGGLSASVSGSTVSFGWIGASGVPTAYLLQAGSSSGSSNIGTFNLGNSSSYTAGGVPNGTYYVRLVATNACGTGPASNEVLFTVGGPGGGGGVAVTALHGFTGSPNDGSNWNTVTQGSDGNFYGTTETGGPFHSSCASNLDGCGLLFRMSPSGAFTVLHTFTASGNSDNQNPIYPRAPLLQGADGNFYGATTVGPSVFRMTPSGTVTYLTNLGGGSYGKLIQLSDGNFYGTTAFGGAGTCSRDRAQTCSPQAGSGTVFRMSPGGALTTLKVFSGGADGSKPYAGMILGNDGSLYGVTQDGARGFGTVFKIRPDGGSFTTLYTFTGGGDGGNPYAPLVQGSDGNFYGTTSFGTSYNAGTVFKITPAGALTTLHVFTGYSVPDGTRPPGVPLDGAYPAAPLIQMADGNFIGTTAGGGPLTGGTAFRISSTGAYTQLFAFAGNAEGSGIQWLIRGNDGNFYGNAQYGGVRNMGAIFRMTPP